MFAPSFFGSWRLGILRAPFLAYPCLRRFACVLRRFLVPPNPLIQGRNKKSKVALQQIDVQRISLASSLRCFDVLLNSFLKEEHQNKVAPSARTLFVIRRLVQGTSDVLRVLAFVSLSSFQGTMRLAVRQLASYHIRPGESTRVAHPGPPSFSFQAAGLNLMVEPSGIEPLASCLQGRRSPS